jgi:hypothetical protein
MRMQPTTEVKFTQVNVLYGRAWRNFESASRCAGNRLWHCCLWQNKLWQNKLWQNKLWHSNLN